MSTFTTYKTRGHGWDADYPHYVYIYPNRDDDDTKADHACEGIVDGLDQLMEFDAIDFYWVRKYNPDSSDSYGYPNCDNSDMTACYNDFKDWYEGKTDHRVGTHIVVDQDFSGGHADGGDSVNKSAFNIARCGSAGMSSGSRASEGTATVIHEALHTMIIKDLVVGNEDSDLAPNNEHELGKVHQDGSNEASPFVNNNNRETSDSGFCNSDLKVKGERAEMVYCEKRGVWETTREGE